MTCELGSQVVLWANSSLPDTTEEYPTTRNDKLRSPASPIRHAINELHSAGDNKNFVAQGIDLLSSRRLLTQL